jgi:hypothetical protein
VQGVPASRLGTADRRRPGTEATRHGSALAHPARRDADDRGCSSPRSRPTAPSATCFAASAASAALRVRQALGTTPPKRSRRCRLGRNPPLHGRAASDCQGLDLAGTQGGPDGGCDATRPRRHVAGRRLVALASWRPGSRGSRSRRRPLDIDRRRLGRSAFHHRARESACAAKRGCSRGRLRPSGVR